MSLPDKATLQRLLAKRTPHHHPDMPFAVLWAQKAGCTFLLKWFLWHVDLLQVAEDYGEDRRGISVHLYEKHVFRAAQDYIDNLARRVEQGIPLINFMRSPYERAFSGYMHINGTYLVELLNSGKTNNTLKLRKKIVADTQGESASPDVRISFPDYLAWLKEQDTSKLNNHLRPQSSPLYGLPGVRHYRLEDSDRVFNQLESEFGLRSSRENRQVFAESGHHNRKWDRPIEKTIEVLNRGIPLYRTEDAKIPRINREVLQQTPFIDLIEDIYSEDIRLYNSLSPV